MRDQTYKQALREPEPTNHPDERMHMTIKHESLRIPAKEWIDPETGKLGKVTPMLAVGGV